MGGPWGSSEWSTCSSNWVSGGLHSGRCQWPPVSGPGGRARPKAAANSGGEGGGGHVRGTLSCHPQITIGWSVRNLLLRLWGLGKRNQTPARSPPLRSFLPLGILLNSHDPRSPLIFHPVFFWKGCLFCATPVTKLLLPETPSSRTWADLFFFFYCFRSPRACPGRVSTGSGSRCARASRLLRWGGRAAAKAKCNRACPAAAPWLMAVVQNRLAAGRRGPRFGVSK